MQSENPDPFQVPAFYPRGPLIDASFTAYNNLGATGFVYDNGASICTCPNTVGPKCCCDVEISLSVPRLVPETQVVC